MGPDVDTSAVSVRRPGLFFNWIVWLLNLELYVYIYWLLTPYQSLPFANIFLLFSTLSFCFVDGFLKNGQEELNRHFSKWPLGT